MESEQIPEVYAADSGEWRAWLGANHAKSPGVWLVFFKKGSGRSSVTWSEAVDEALCFGWVDSKANRLDEHRYKQYFTKRKAKSTWSRINKEKVEALIAAGRMADAGLLAVEVAKENDWWTILDGPEAGIVPDDLAAALDGVPGARAGFDALSFSQRKMILASLVLAVRPDTRSTRIARTVEAAARGESPFT